MVQTKILYTMILMRVMLKKEFTPVQLSAGALLFVGAIVSDSQSHCSEHDLKEQSGMGLILSQIIGVMSACAGVYSEALAKFDGSVGNAGGLSSVSLHKQNMQLYIWGLLFNTVPLMASSGGMAVFFRGIGPIAIAIIFMSAMTGLVVSAIVKYLDNMVKLLAMSVVPAASLLASYLGFGVPISLHVMLGFIIISVASFLYSYKPPVPVFIEEKDKDIVAVEAGDASPRTMNRREELSGRRE